MTKAPQGWAEVSIRVCIPLHVLKGLAQSIQEKLMHGGYVDANMLIADYDGTALHGADVFEFFAFLGGHGDLTNITVRFKESAECGRIADAGSCNADSETRNAGQAGGRGAGDTGQIDDTGE